MFLGDKHLDFRESGLQFGCQYCHNGVFCVEMSGIDQVHAQLLCVPKVIVLSVGGHEGIAACPVGVHQLGSTGTTAYSNVFNLFAAVYKLQPLAAQVILHMTQKDIL